jgi:nucleoside-triphosphatase THEP1
MVSHIIKSKRFWVAFAILTGLLFIKHYPILIGILLFFLALFFDKTTTRPLKNYRFWIVIILLIIAVPLFTGIADKSILGINYSSQQLQKAVIMAMRGISIFLMFQVLTINLSVEKIKPLFNKIGSSKFEILYNISNDNLPKIKSILLARYGLFKQNWKSSKTANTILNFVVDIFIDILDLVDRLSAEDSNKSPSPQELISKITGLNNLILISGDEDSGKTTWIENFIQYAKHIGMQVDGLYSKKRIETNGNWYHNLIRISTKDKRQLDSMEPFETKIKIGKFYFDAKNISWANKQLVVIDPNTNWIIIDEIGLLEFKGGGFLPGLTHIANREDNNIIITIRPSLIKHLDEFIKDNIPALGSLDRYLVAL